MSKTFIIQGVLCPWCYNAMDIIQSEKTGYYYANCTHCNGHFRNIPIALIDAENREFQDKSEADTGQSPSRGKGLGRFFKRLTDNDQEETQELPPILKKYLKKAESRGG